MRAAAIAPIFERARAGDTEALSELLEQTQPDLRRYAQRSCLISDVDDAVQETLWILSRYVDRVKSALGISDELNVGSVGVKLCLIAAAERDLYVNPAAKTKAWDTCAPEAILVRAGGRLSDLRGDLISYRELPQRNGLVASNGVIHDEVIAKLGALFPRGTLNG